MKKFKSVSVPVTARQWFKDSEFDYNGSINSGDWVVEFPNGEIHIVKDSFFKLRFEEVEEFTEKEVTYARIMSQIGDCV